MADLLLPLANQARLTPAQQQAVDQVLLVIAASSDRSPAAQGVIRAARALKRAQDEQARAVKARDQNAAAAATDVALDVQAALLRAVGRMPESRSKPRWRSSSGLPWTRLAFG